MKKTNIYIFVIFSLSFLMMLALYLQNIGLLCIGHETNWALSELEDKALKRAYKKTNIHPNYIDFKNDNSLLVEHRFSLTSPSPEGLNGYHRFYIYLEDKQGDLNLFDDLKNKLLFVAVGYDRCGNYTDISGQEYDFDHIIYEKYKQKLTNLRRINDES